MTNQIDEIQEQDRTLAWLIFGRCNWKTVAISLFFSVFLSLLILDHLIKANLVISLPTQMLGCLAYMWDVPITSRLWAVGCTMLAALAIFLGLLSCFSAMEKERQDSMARFGLLSILPVICCLTLGLYSVDKPVDYSWIMVSCLVFVAIFWLHLWRKKCPTDMDFVLLFCSFFIPYGFCCLGRAVCYSWFPEYYRIFFDWGCQKLAMLPYGSFALILILLSFPRDVSDNYRRVLCAVLQLLMLPLFTWLLPEVYLRGDHVIALHSFGKTFWCIVFPLILLATADIVIRAWKPGLLKHDVSPFPLMAILALETFIHFSVMGLTNFFEFGDRITDYYAIRSGAMTLFKDTTPGCGLWDFFSLRMTDFFSDTFTMADTYGGSLITLFAMCVSFYVFFHCLPLGIAFVLSYFLGGWFPGLLAAFIMVWIHPDLLKRRGLWCVVWSISATFLVFFRIPHGAMLAAAFVPLFLYQFFLAFVEDRKLGWKLLGFEAFWGFLFFVWPFSSYCYGLIRVFCESASINTAWATLDWNNGSGALFPFMAANAILFLPVLTVFLSGLVLVSDVPMSAGNRKTFVWGIFSASMCYTFITLNDSFSSLDDLFSNQYQTFIVLLPILLVPAFLLPVKLGKIKALLLTLAFAPLIVSFVRDPNVPDSPLNAIPKPLSAISDANMVRGEDFDLPRAGYGFAPEGCREELQAEREVKELLDQVLEPGETFLNLSLNGGLYFLFDRELPAQHSNYFSVTGDQTQYRMLKQLSGKDVVVSVFGRECHDFSYPMLWTFYLYRYAIKDAWPLKVNDKYFVMMPESYFRKIGRTVPTQEESVAIWDDFYNSGLTVFQFDNLVHSTAVWGRNGIRLLRDLTDASMPLPLPQGEPLLQKVLLPQPVSGEEWGILEIDSEHDCWAGVTWTNEFEKPYRICFKLAPGKNLVPLDIYPHWFQAKENREFEFFSQNYELKITSLTLHRRKLPQEIQQKKKVE